MKMQMDSAIERLLAKKRAHRRKIDGIIEKYQKEWNSEWWETILRMLEEYDELKKETTVDEG